MSKIPGLTYRKRRFLTKAEIPEGTTIIGDAAYSLCPYLKNVVIPSSVEYIGVAAFCGSGLENVTFLGLPLIERKAFYDCKDLKNIIVPTGSKHYFEKMLPLESIFIIEESNNDIDSSPSKEDNDLADGRSYDLWGNDITPLENDPTLFSMDSTNNESENNKPTTNVKRCRLEYNAQFFSWSIDDKVELSQLFSNTTYLQGDPSYQFRKKAIFIFLKSHTKDRTNTMRRNEYAIGANTVLFNNKYNHKYGHYSTPVRIVIFVCDDNKTAYFFDEVKLIRIATNTIIVESLIRY